MSSLIFRIVGGLVAVLAVILVGMWVLGLGPFNTRPSAAAKVQPKVTAAVARTSGEAKATVAKVETQTKTANAATEKRTEGHVAKIRAAAPRAAPAAVPDREFYLGVCESELYAGSPDCSGFRGQPEGRGAGARAGAVRGR